MNNIGMADRVTPRSGSGLNKSVQATMALVFCTAGGQDFIMRHDAGIGAGGDLELGSGQPISVAKVLDLACQLDSSDNPGWVGEDVIASNPNQMVWVVEAAVRPMWFSLSGSKIKLVVPWPRLILIADRAGRLRAFATKEKGKPTAKTELFHAPLMNFNHVGGMCFGGVTLPRFDVDNRAAFARAVTNTYFTHVNHPYTLRGRGKKSKEITGERHVAFWKKLNGAKTFPLHALVPTGAKLQSAASGK